MKLLVSPINNEEAISALKGGADIIDVKNPKEGSLGANFPGVIKGVKETVGNQKPISAALGDFNYKPGTAALAAYGAAAAGADYVKIGLYDIQTEEQAYEMLAGITEAVRTMDNVPKVVACAYSDYARINSIDPALLPAIGAKAGVDLVMVDTGVKDGRSTFEFLNEAQLKDFVEKAHANGLETALAGSIKFEDIEAIMEIKPDILGVRGIVCGGDRSTSIKQELVEQLRARLS
ncbi:(5-formylfuran-3-yl)methyl phosphate synthase [Methanohalophilus sp. RSK]|uniref:(5-formylfuran-3-yl)methyl phosphate synthase n=1 Tax=Methanohalophilus sp. RSK TaxID=2485783 RepID=UPI000F43B087|nr:(5-formylfuran-3-yl)methyl phosphate synthase [Methanohalophilus sp. RSK]RNI15328.1 (5-formylfuran-3-yl)methyl phosphate synthase [Methanohalophilus sp. RSK]